MTRTRSETSPEDAAAEVARVAVAGEAVAPVAELAALYGAGTVGIAVVDGDGVVMRVNDSLATAADTTAEAAVGRPLAALFPEIGARLDEMVATVTAEGTPLPAVELRTGVEDGREPRDWCLSLVPIAGDDGRPRAVSCLWRDVSATKRARDEVAARVHDLELLHSLSADVVHARHLDDLYEHALDAVLEAVHTADRAALLLLDDEKVMRFRAWRGLSDHYRAAVEGHNPWSLRNPAPAPIVVADVAADEELGALRETVLTEDVRSLVFLPIAVGERLIGKFMLYAARPHAFDGELHVATTIANQIGFAIERHRREEALREADRRKDGFLAVLAHELRNPLAAIANCVEALRRNQLDGDRRETLDAMVRAQVRQLVRLVDDLLDVSRISQGKVELSRSRIATAAAIGRAIEVVRPQIDERRQRLAVSIGSGCTTLVADPVRLEQVLVNLLSNASKYGKAGGRIQVTIEQRGDEDGGGDGDPGDWIDVAVTDDGIGLEREERAAVFEPFRRIRDDERGGGLGVGLSLVRRLVELHGGTVRVASPGRGHGSTFTASLPAAAVPDEGEPAAPAPAPAATGHRRVLVVDDNRAAAEALGLLLEGEGWEVTTAFGGEEALAAARREPPEIVLLDLEMPGIDGFEVARALRRDAVLGDSLLVAVTGFGHEEARRRVREAGFDHHLVKPVDVDALLALVARFA